MEFPYTLTAARLLFPMLILRWPLWGLVTCMAIDAFDWQLFPFTDQASYELYQHWDKTLDLYYWLFTLTTVRQLKDQLAKKLIVFLFIYRILGMGVFLVTDWRPALFLFPNLFENTLLFYLLYVTFSRRNILFTSWKKTLIIVGSVALPKLIHEYFMHFLIQQPWEIYDLVGWLQLSGATKEYTNYFLWGSLLYSGTLITVWWYIKQAKTSSPSN